MNHEKAMKHTIQLINYNKAIDAYSKSSLFYHYPPGVGGPPQINRRIYKKVKCRKSGA